MQSKDFSNYTDEFDDQFESGEMSGSGFQASNAKPASNMRPNDTQKGKTGYELVDFNVSASASLLPPLASGMRPTGIDTSGNNHQVPTNPTPSYVRSNDLKPEHF